MRKLSALLLLIIGMLTALPTSAQVLPNYSKAIRTFGDYTNANPAPTSGTLTGVYRTSGDWTQTGPVTCNGCRLYFGGKVQINNTFTCTAGVEENAAASGVSGSTPFASYVNAGAVLTWSKERGNGPGAGWGYINTQTDVWSSSGGGHGGAGGGGTNLENMQPGGGTYRLENSFLAGSSGGAPGTIAAASSGAGGGGLYIESIGPITLTSSANVTANGANAGAGSGSGGSGGGIDIRSLSSITISTGALISANGGNAVSSGGGGGGGIVSLMPGPGASFSQLGTVGVSGGTGAGGGLAGATGVTNLPATFTGPRVGI